MEQSVLSAILGQGGLAILAAVLWLQSRDRDKREDERNVRNEQAHKDRTAADIEVAKALTLLAERIER